jgi:hypothetical protein
VSLKYDLESGQVVRTADEPAKAYPEPADDGEAKPD